MAKKLVAKKYKANVEDSCEITARRVKNFLNTEVKSYAEYVLRTRTMPSIMDGLRVGARKIIWASLTGDLQKKPFLKMPALIGQAMQVQYAHGDASLANTIVNLCCTHLNKYAPLEAIGQIPSLRVPNCDTATRYLMIRKSPYLDLFKMDKELLEIQEEEGEKIEPKYFLPIIPFALLYRTSSPGFGFAYKTNSYRLEDIIDNVIQAVIKGTCQDNQDSVPLTPEIQGIKPENLIFNANKNRWYSVGEYELEFENDVLKITDLPYDVSFENIEETLTQLKDKFIISDWLNLSQKEKITYIVKFPKGRMRQLYNTNQWNFFKTFKLYSPIKPDIMNFIDEDGKTILFFENPYQMIDCFVKKRLYFYDKRKSLTIKKLKEQLAVYDNQIKFINLFIEGKIEVFKRKKEDILADLKKFEIESYVLDMKVWNLTKEQIDILNQLRNETQEQLDYITRTSIETMYVSDLIDLREKLCGITNKTQKITNIEKL